MSVVALVIVCVVLYSIYQSNSKAALQPIKIKKNEEPKRRR
jgi:hypothetical protein